MSEVRGVDQGRSCPPRRDIEALDANPVSWTPAGRNFLKALACLTILDASSRMTPTWAMPLPGFVFVFEQPRLKRCDGCMDSAGTGQGYLTILVGCTPPNCQSVVQNLKASADTTPIGPIAECANATLHQVGGHTEYGGPQTHLNIIGTHGLIFTLNCNVTSTRLNKVC
jgi:hypothetical protein